MTDNVIYLSPQSVPVKADHDLTHQIMTDLAALWGFEQPASVSPSELLTTARLREQRLAKLERELQARADQIAELQHRLDAVGQAVIDDGNIMQARELLLNARNGGAL